MKLKLLFLPLFLMILSSPTFAKDCKQDIDGNDKMQFNLKEIKVPKGCTTMKLNLEHSGKMAKKTMGHNWILAKTKDIAAIVKSGLSAGLAGGYIKKGDSRILAHTILLGGGEKTSISIDLTKIKKGGDYSFFCAFPGHYILMRGKFKY
ncbi:MAG: azurin [SAR324 cluster bacterium]|nr:azurin [SAR324 cluster bacterium]